MKLLWRLLFGKPAKAQKPKKAEKPKKKILPVLMDKLAVIPLKALELKWSEDLWKPDVK